MTAIISSEVACKYCDDTGYIGSPLEVGHYPCTDCEMWIRKVRKSRNIKKDQVLG
jgi:hypothetical protein